MQHSILTLALTVTVLHASQAHYARAVAAEAFDQTLELFGISFHVTASNEGSSPTVTITPSGLEIDNRPIEHEVSGTIVRAEVADLNVDQSPEIYIFVETTDAEGGAASVSQGLIAYSANNLKSLSEIYLPAVAGNPEASQGYRGGDELAVVENSFARRFPIYREGDADGEPSGGTRQIQYELTPGEAGWVLAIDKISEF